MRKISTCCLVLLCAIAAPVLASDTDTDTDTDAVLKTAAGILWVMTPSKETYLRPYRSMKAFTNPAYRLELARAFVDSARRYNLPVSLLMAMGYRESVFRPLEVGPAGELGIMQVGKYGRRKCECQNMETVAGGIDCGACWLDMGRKMCKGSLDGALGAYVSGKCNPDHIRAKRAVQIRKRLQKQIDGLGG